MMKYDVKCCKVLQKREIATDIFDMTVEAPAFAELAQAGQFAHIYVPGKTLRRPISICGVDRAAGTLRFVFQIRGDGTRILAETNEGELLDILAPLGHGFNWETSLAKRYLWAAASAFRHCWKRQNHLVETPRPCSVSAIKTRRFWRRISAPRDAPCALQPTMAAQDTTVW